MRFCKLKRSRHWFAFSLCFLQSYLLWNFACQTACFNALKSCCIEFEICIGFFFESNIYLLTHCVLLQSREACVRHLCNRVKSFKSCSLRCLPNLFVQGVQQDYLVAFLTGNFQIMMLCVACVYVNYSKTLCIVLICICATFTFTQGQKG